MNVLVIGGAGYIGSHTVVELVEAEHNPIIVDNFVNSNRSVLKSLEKLLNKKVTSYEVDYADESAMKKIIQRESIEAIIHFGALKKVGESVKEPLKYYDNNVVGLVRLMKVVNDTGIKHFVFSSSCTVYGEPDRVPVTEASPMKPATSPYGATKQIGEMIVKDVSSVSKTLNALSLRYFNPIGAHPSALIGELPLGEPENLIPIVTETAAGIRKQLVVYGDDYDTPDGSCIRDYIHVVDLAKAHVQALSYLIKKKPSHYDAINVGTGKGTSVLEVIRTFEKTTNAKLSYVIGKRRAGDIVSTYAEVDKAKKELNWQAQKTLADALKDAWSWQQTL